MFELALIGLALFSIVKIVALIKLSDIYFIKGKPKNNDDIVELSDDSQLDESTKYKRDYFK
ncbi:hypothetical protein ACVRZD_03300 [Streptococcus hongkongensis]|nr:hypothetical protein NC01_04660 [Streptococcus uberis]